MTKPKSVGMSKGRLERMDAFLKERYLDTGKLPGTLTAVHRRGETVHLGVQGHADLERSRPLTEDAVFRIYSMTKPVTSVALMMLVEQGLIALDDPVSKFIPSWKGLGVFAGGIPTIGFQTTPVEREMQVVDLLRHTSGLTYGFQNRTNVDAAYRKRGVGELVKSGTLASMIENLAELPLEFSPGTAWNYSVSTDVLGWLVQVVSGLPFERFLEERIFQPLGMTDTAFQVSDANRARLAACYALTATGKVVLQDDPEKSPYLEAPGLVSGGGGLVSTAADYLRFCRMLLNGGTLDGARILAPHTVKLMTANHLPGGQSISQMSRSLFSEAAYDGVGFGLGFSVTLDPSRTLIPGSAGEFSWGGAASTTFWIDPVEELIVIFMTQLIPSSAYPVRRELRTLAYAAITDAAVWPHGEG